MLSGITINNFRYSDDWFSGTAVCISSGFFHTLSSRYKHKQPEPL